MEKNENDFFKLMQILAKMCNFDLDGVLPVYDKLLSSHGYGKINAGLREIITSRRSRDPFPSVREIIEKSNPVQNVKADANIIVSLITGAIRRYGYTWIYEEDFQKQKREELGEYGVQVVELSGGWDKLCQDSNNCELGTFRAQLRELATGVIERMNRGESFVPRLQHGDNAKRIGITVGTQLRDALDGDTTKDNDKP